MEIRNKLIASAAGLFILGGVLSVDGQTNRRRSTASTKPTPTPIRAEPEVISRADQYLDENGRVITPIEPESVQIPDPENRLSEGYVADLEQRLEGNKKVDSAEKQRRLALNLDILTKSEQRVESLRKQYFEMVEKEAQIQQRLDTLELETRPDAIDRSVAFAGSLRPEVLREARQKTLAAERVKLQTLMAEVQKNKANLDVNVQRADSLVERLRTRLEKEIDEALLDDTEKPDEN